MPFLSVSEHFRNGRDNADFRDDEGENADENGVKIYSE
jgi:hypothetical protein